MKDLYNKLQDRLNYLLSQEENDDQRSRISEINLCIVEVQKLLLDKINIPKENLIKIRNVDYATWQLDSYITKEVLEEVEKYKLDPNCWADLWVSDPSITLTEREKIAFIYIINHKNN